MDDPMDRWTGRSMDLETSGSVDRWMHGSRDL